MINITQLDPAQAWSLYQPESPDGWTLRQAAHLYRRGGFSANREQLEQALTLNPGEAVHQLLNSAEESVSQYETLAKTMLATGNANNLSAWWMYRLLQTADPLREKMTIFWHGHFATSAEKVTDPQLMYHQNQLLRSNALEDFGSLLHDISRDPAMLLYLDSATNRKAHPNENFAREIMELFCLGEGNYTEQDIRELARCFTGWEVRANRFRFNRYQHDKGEKNIFGQSGEFDGDAGVDLVLAHPAGPEFICRKLVKFLVVDEPVPSVDLIAPLARQFRENGLQIGPIVERILSSKLFFSNDAIGRKIRSPIEFSVGLLQSLEVTTNYFELSKRLADLGQKLFFPPNVKGWDGGRTWVNSSTLLARANLVQDLLDREETRFAGGGMTDLCDKHELHRPTEIVDWLQTMLLADELSPEVRSGLVRELESGTDPRERRLRQVVYLMCTLPEFQLG
ncbi:MAG: DUF1800 domain-containing protein [Planctomycetaceae bacterium]|jgi:uncharacterized protein (DUF1800 family)|nr:DUF1800 domain-containing protein [Planctomycetaceae bacterium]MDC0273306.1 DUF1800 domain-containing protein [Planctomycetaceae bacterium]MDG2390082.1 DUF1800 domain-containing protein [Planctomycetaceae bacterium]